MHKKLHFSKKGKGKKSLILFHGFGQTHTAFDAIESSFQDEFTIYAFDLYYHGQSERLDGRLYPHEWEADLRQFIATEGIDQFSIVAFSLGGRFALATANIFPTSVEKLILIAPDGLYKNFWYVFSTSRIGNSFFRFMMLNPSRFDRLLDVFEKWKLTSPSMIRFARKELADRENCLKVYRSWTYFRPLQLSSGRIANMLNASEIEAHLILGEKDYIIPKKEVVTETRRIAKLHMHILPLKHHHLIDGSKDLLQKILCPQQ